jgi:hypothetical protein
VSYACSSDLINGWEGGAIQYEHGVAFLTPLGETLAAYRQKMPGKKMAFDGGNPALDVLVTRSSSGSRYNVAVLNRDAKRDFEVKLDFGKWKPARLEEWTINSMDPGDKRDFSSLGNVPTNKRKLTKGVADYRIPASAHSVTIVTFQK